MPLLLRLMICLTLLANTAGGVWAAHRLGLAPSPTSMTASASCHDAPAAHHAMAQGDHAHNAMQAADHHGAGCCAQGSCDCLQHCGTTISLPASLAVTWLPGQRGDLRDARGRGLPLPYQPVRPPIA